MKHFKKTIFLTISTILFSLCAPLLAKTSTNDEIRLVGRFTDDLRFGWTGCSIETFLWKGRKISADLECVEGDSAGLEVIVDGTTHFLKVEKGRKTYLLADGLNPDKKHFIQLFKRSEGWLGTVKFYGFIVSEKATLSAPKEKHRKLLVIGDSITCGYGNEGKTPESGNSVEIENGYMSYAAIAARELNADLMMVCWSGRGLFRNLQPNPKDKTLPKLFSQILPMQEMPQWDPSTFQPDIIVINLGTNDKNAPGGTLREEDFSSTYKQFIRQLRGYWPRANIILSIGPMVYQPISDWLPKIADGIKNTSVLIYTPYSGKEEIGGHYHPSVLKDQKMAKKLVETICNEMNWSK